VYRAGSQFSTKRGSSFSRFLPHHFAPVLPDHTAWFTVQYEEMKDRKSLSSLLTSSLCNMREEYADAA
jgi:hypothetical protein